MKLADLFPAENIVFLSEIERVSVLERLAAEVASRTGGKLAADVLLERLTARENDRSTALGSGIAIPHAKAAELESLVCVAGVLAAGVPFDAPDGEPCRLFFCIVAPESQPAAHLKALALVMRATRTAELRASLASCTTPGEFTAILQRVGDS